MQSSIQTSPQYAQLLGDPELAALLSPESELKALIAVEIALANSQAQLGLIPADTAERMQAALIGFNADSQKLSDGILSSGVPIPALLAQLRAALPDDLSQWLHWGATSQDIVDTAAVLQLRDCLQLLEIRLKQTIDALQEQSSRHAQTIMAARTRTQLATPITLGLRMAQWAQPLITLESELPALKTRLLKLQFGGASGANTAVAPQGPAISQLMAQQLNLRDAAPWHTERGSITCLSHWLTQLSTALTKMGKDLMISARSEIAELRAGTAGGSSTMPQKANPVQSEMLLTMNTVAQALSSGLLAAASPAEERDGASWTAEWILLPQLLTTVGCALRHGLSLAQTLNPDVARMAQTISDNPQLMAEAASFALAAHMPRSEAQALVKQAALSDKPFEQALADISDAQIDWRQTLDASGVVGPCKQISDAIFSQREK